MAGLASTLSLLGYALGTLGGVLVFLEFFQVPSYVAFDEDLGAYNLDIAPEQVREHTWLGRVGGLCLALGFALLFLGAFL